MLDLCIVGAPKCGTSSLFQWLTAHPQISGPENEKELFFFMDLGHPLIEEPNVHTASIETYGMLFPDDAKRMVEGTTHYLFQKTARKHLCDMGSQPLIVAVLRDPAQRVWSSFRYTQNNLARVDPSLSFSQYVRWGLNGKAGQIADYVSHPGSSYVLSRDIEYSKYINYLAPWREAVGTDRLLLIEFSELVEQPRSICRRLTSVLGVDTSFYDDFNLKSQNSTYETKSSRLHSLARQVGRWVPDGKIKKYAKQAYMRVATSESVSASEGDKQALHRLQEYYLSHNQRLSREFGVDASSWS